jgi:hypothetical protein
MRPLDEKPDPRSTLTMAEFARKPNTELDDQVFNVSAEGFVYPLRLKIEPGADRLFVMLHGAVRRHKRALPLFARWNWGKVLKGHVLAVCDPTLYHARVELGWYLGTGFKHALPGLVGIAEEMRRKLDVQEGRMIFYGGSGGGFSAIKAASSLGPHGRALAVNPQIDLLKYNERHVRLLARALGRPGQPWNWNDSPRPHIHAIEAYREACARGPGPGVVVAQNRLDDIHLADHYPDFVDAVGLPREGGYDRQRLLGAILFDKPGGHSAGESVELVRQFCDEAIPFLLKEDQARQRQSRWWRLWR